MIPKTEGYGEFRAKHGGSDNPQDDVYLGYEIAEMVEFLNGELPGHIYGELMDLGALLHDLGINTVPELERALGSRYNGAEWERNDKEDAPTPPDFIGETCEHKPVVNERRQAVEATRKKNGNGSSPE